MDVTRSVAAIKRRFEQTGRTARIPLLKGGTFTAELVDGGINVSNLADQPFLPWGVFHETVLLLMRNKGYAKRGNAMEFKLGETGLPLDSVEGHIAHVVYGKQPGDSVFRRITPIACILIWAGVCEPAPNLLILRDYRR